MTMVSFTAKCCACGCETKVVTDTRLPGYDGDWRRCAQKGCEGAIRAVSFPVAVPGDATVFSRLPESAYGVKEISAEHGDVAAIVENATGRVICLEDDGTANNSAAMLDELNHIASRLARLTAIESAAKTALKRGHLGMCAFFNYRYRGADGYELPKEPCSCGHDALVAAFGVRCGGKWVES